MATVLAKIELRTSSNKNVQAGLRLNILNAHEEAMERGTVPVAWRLDCQRCFPSLSPPCISITPFFLRFPSSRLLRNKNVAWLLKRLPL